MYFEAHMKGWLETSAPNGKSFCENQNGPLNSSGEQGFSNN